jgi:hypothetical protein
MLWALDTARRGVRYVELQARAEVLRPAKDAGLRMTIKAGGWTSIDIVDRLTGLDARFGMTILRETRGSPHNAWKVPE